MVASKATLEQAGNDSYRDDHLSKLVKDGMSFSGYERNSLYLNLHSDGFLNISGVSGTDSILDGRGAVFADFDNDGDLDIFLTTIQQQTHLLFRNNVGQQVNCLRILLQGTDSGQDAYGTVVRVKTSSGILTKQKSGGAGYLAQHDPRLLFGLGNDTSAEWLEITWPSGVVQRFTQVEAGSVLRVVEGAAPEKIEEHRFSFPDPFPQEQAFLAKLKIRPGMNFPDVAITSLKNRKSRFRETLRSDQRYLVNLWATYCIPCATEMPELQRLRGSLNERGIEVLGLNLDAASRGNTKQTRELVERYLKQREIGYPIYLADANIIERIYATDEVFIPLSFLLDEAGRILEIHSGWSKETQERLSRHARP